MIDLQTAIMAIVVFSILIFVHEFGHFIMAKLTGVKVLEFSIGMGPRGFSTMKGDTLYSVRLLPIGGYVKMAGETGYEEDVQFSDDPSFFNNKTVLQRTAVIIAGPLMNLLLAMVLFALIFSIVGVPYIGTEVGQVVENSPAARAGLEPGDKIVGADGQKIQEWNQLVGIIQSNPGKSIDFVIIRGEKELNLAITPEIDPESEKAIIGIIQTQSLRRVNIIEGFTFGIQQTIEIIVLTLSALGQMIAGKMGAEGVAGPVGIIQLIGESAQVGWVYLVNLMAVISINLGLINLLPIPALDGSKLIFLAIEGIRRKPVDLKKENFVHLVGFALLMALMLMITYRDIMRLLGLGD